MKDRVEIMTILGTGLAIVAIMVTMFINLGSKIDGFQAEMRDIHGRVSAIEVTVGI
jgi:hypothetical protein